MLTADRNAPGLFLAPIAALLVVVALLGIDGAAEHYDGALLVDPAHPEIDRALQIRSGHALVTGAGGGIGSEIAAGLAAAGLDLIIAHRPGAATRYTALLSELWASRGLTTRFVLEEVDLANATSVLAFIRRVRARYTGSLRVVVNNAAALVCRSGRASPSPRDCFVLPEPPPLGADGLPLMLEVNLWAPWKLSTALAPVLRASRRPASVVNVASIFAGGLSAPMLESGSPTWGYPQTKMALRMLTWELDERVGRVESGSPVFFNAVHPGTLLTKLASIAWIERMCATSRLGGASVTCQSRQDAAARAVWLAVNAPALELHGTWWEMSRAGSVSEQRPRKFDDPRMRDLAWQYIERVDRELERRASPTERTEF